jgi:putative DNA primase/helicase
MSVTRIQAVASTRKLQNYARLAGIDLSEEYKQYAEQNRSDIEDERVEIILEDLTEDNLALAFAEQFKKLLRYCHTRGAWFAWDGARWKQERTLLAFHYARSLCREYNRKQKEPSRTVAGVRTAAAVERFAISDRCLAVTEEFWNADPWLLATPTGTVDLSTGELRPPNPDDHITLSTGIGLESGTPTLWLRFLDEATQGNQELQRFLQQIAGYCLTGITREHALFFFYGPGGNGKGVFVNTLSAIMNEYATSAPMDSFTASKHDRHPTDLASLAGARMVTASETEEGRAWAESRIKTVTGGDPVKARFMRRDFFEYTPEYKLVFLGNHKPVLRNVDDAARRRFNIIPFTHKPACPDLELPEKLKAEYGQILGWMIDGCLDWQQHGLKRPEIVTAATAEYFDEQDLFSQWIEECTEKKSERIGETTTALFGSWKRYAEAAGDSSGTQRSFRDNMRLHGYEYRPHLPNNHNGRGFVGIVLKVIEDAYKPYVD